MSDPGGAELRVLVISSHGFLAEAWTAALRKRGHAPVAYLTTRGPARRRGDGYRAIVDQFGGTADIVISSKPSLWRRVFEPYELDLIVCMGFPWRLPADFIDLPRLGAINGHPSLLPNYRGAGPNVFGWMFRNGERETGMTVHRMSPEFDTGAILAQERVPILEDDSVTEVQARLGSIIIGVLEQGIAAAEAGVAGTPQPPGEGFYCEPFEPSWRTVDWSRPARAVHDQVRSWTGLEDHGHASATLDGVELVIRRTRLVDGGDRADAAPGTVLKRSDDELLIQCGDGAIRVVDWSPAS